MDGIAREILKLELADIKRDAIRPTDPVHVVLKKLDRTQAFLIKVTEALLVADKPK